MSDSKAFRRGNPELAAAELCKTTPKSASAALRPLLPIIESRINEGVDYGQILRALRKAGYRVEKATLKKQLAEFRKKGGVAHPPSEVQQQSQDNSRHERAPAQQVITSNTTEEENKPFTRAELIQIRGMEVDLEGLAKRAKLRKEKSS